MDRCRLRLNKSAGKAVANVCIFTFHIIIFVAYISYVHNQTLFIYGVFLSALICISCVNVNGNDLFSPLTWFSLIYYGYAIGSVYYSFGNMEYGKFLNMTDISPADTVYYLEKASMWAVVSYFLFVTGYAVFNSKCTFSRRVTCKGYFYFVNSLSKVTIPLLLLIGGAYWVYLSYVLSGGIPGMLLNFSVFHHLIKENGGTTLPYHFYYVGILLWLFVIVFKGEKPGILFILFSFFGFVMNLSQGRIMNSITFILVQVAFYGIVNEEFISTRKRALYILLAFTVAFSLLFLRVSSSLYFIGEDPNYLISEGLMASIKLGMNMIIGQGNIADLQQMAIIMKVWTGKYMFGTTYIYWLNNMLANFLGTEPASIGLMIKDMYFADKSGPPTPGAIGELYANFGLFGFGFMFLIGGALSVLYRKVKASGNIIVVFFYAMFLMRFVLLFPKVDSTAFANALWLMMPFFLMLFTFSVMYEVTRNSD